MEHTAKMFFPHVFSISSSFVCTVSSTFKTLYSNSTTSLLQTLCSVSMSSALLCHPPTWFPCHPLLCLCFPVTLAFLLPLTQGRLRSFYLSTLGLAIWNTHHPGIHTAISFHHLGFSWNVTSSERSFLTALYKEAIFCQIFHPIIWTFFIVHMK